MIRKIEKVKLGRRVVWRGLRMQVYVRDNEKRICYLRLGNHKDAVAFGTTVEVVDERDDGDEPI